ncbi:MAG: hypothetical protein M3552_16490 [Planctomycetota bacterium]|nr:hypothetical protein [Planctomycetaceae bacterium]MDQ3332221.1 hypothetical protein [Planctomycetota bacterium]
MPASQRPLWKRKCWIAAAVLCLVLWYPLSLWPVAYAVGRGWLAVTQVQALYLPILLAADALRPHPGIGLAPPDKDGKRRYIVLPDPDPSPEAVGAAAESYLNIVEWFDRLGKRHAASE